MENLVNIWTPNLPSQIFLGPAVAVGLPDLELFEQLVKQFPDTVITNKNVLPELNKWKRGLYFKPGAEFRHCNTEYNILALLIEKEGGSCYQAYVKKHIFQVAGMDSSYVGQPDNATHDLLLAMPQMKLHPGYDTTIVLVDSITRYRYLSYNRDDTKIE